MNKIRVFLTFDFELPLGGINASYDESLFKPAYRLIDQAGELNVPVILFADILSYLKFKEWNVPEFYREFEKQIKYTLENNSDVQLHLHPHWLDSKFEKNNFIPSANFTLGKFNENNYPLNIEGVVEKGYNALNELCSGFDQNYQCIAYRAGGYSLSPDTPEILQALYKNGIRVDASISPGYYFKSDYSEVDYRKVPAKPNWHLDFSGDFAKDAGKGIYEVPIASKPKSVFEVPTKFKLKKYSYRARPQQGKMIHAYNNLVFRDKLKILLSSRMLTVDNYTYSHKFLIDILDHHVGKFRKFDTIDLCLIGHPKGMGDYSLELFTEFVRRSREKYKDHIQFCTFKSEFGNSK